MIKISADPRYAFGSLDHRIAANVSLPYAGTKSPANHERWLEFNGLIDDLGSPRLAALFSMLGPSQDRASPLTHQSYVVSVMRVMSGGPPVFGIADWQISSSAP